MMAVQRNHAAAEAEYRDILATRLRVQGPDNPYTLSTRHEIARMMAEQGNPAAAEAELRDILTAKLRVLGPDHPSTLITRHGLARMMAELGHRAAAAAEFCDILSIRQRVLGPSHPETKGAAAWVDYLKGPSKGLSAAPTGRVPKVSGQGWTPPHNCPTVLVWPRW